MIPIKLTLKNFMSYGDPAVTVPFEGLHVACLSGDNGNGKSAVLDAITWVLWGRTRASSVRSAGDDDLIRLGTDEAEVRFEFELNSQTYRAIRKRRRGKAGSSDWQIALLNSASGWTPIGGNSHRETGRQIVQLLSMEYETFLNSAYLQQGRADEFARQTPDSRKRILGEILGLDRYDRLEEKARTRTKERKETAEDLEREIRILDGQIAQLPEHRSRLEETHTAHREMTALLEAQEKRVADLRTRRARLDALAEQLARSELRLKRLHDDAALRAKERCTQSERLESLRKTLEQKEAILGDYAAWQRATKRRDELEPMVEALSRAFTEQRTVIGAIDAAQKELQGDLRVAESKVANAQERLQEQQQMADQARALTQELQTEPDYELLLAEAQMQQQTLQQEFSDLSAKNKEIAAGLEDLNEVIDLLALPRAACPVCESDLSGEKQARVLKRQEAKRVELQQKQQEVQQDGRAKKQELTTAQKLAAERARLRDAQLARQHRLADLRARLEQRIDSKAELAVLQQKADSLRLQLDRGEFAGPQRVHRQRIEKEIERLGPAKKEYETVRQQIQRLESAGRRHQDLIRAEADWDRERLELERLGKLLESLVNEQSEAKIELEARRAELTQHTEVARTTAEAEAELRRLQSEINRLNVTEGSLLRYIAEAERAAEDRKAREALRAKADEERRIFQALAGAFSKKGVQALIIENAIPELADEANSLLTRMTDNAMQVDFETTRAAKQGRHEIETLDIRITDDAGTRPYELFSGGEAFRINFAIRIALSRLLARRSGAKLQTLILDEGFGSQDGKGREKLLEVIEAIKDDFEKIIVITHIEELKDAFSQRIEITKDAAGSHVHVL